MTKLFYCFAGMVEISRADETGTFQIERVSGRASVLLLPAYGTQLTRCTGTAIRILFETPGWGLPSQNRELFRFSCGASMAKLVCGLPVLLTRAAPAHNSWVGNAG